MAIAAGALNFFTFSTNRTSKMSMTTMNRANHKNLILSLLIFSGIILYYIILYVTLKGFKKDLFYIIE